MDSYWQETSVDEMWALEWIAGWRRDRIEAPVNYDKDGCRVEEMQALCGVMIIMGIQYLPQDRLYWDKDEFTGNIGIKKTFSVNRFHKLLEYLHISDRASEAQRNDPNYDKLGKIHPMLEIIQQRFLEHYMPGKEQLMRE